MHLTLNQIEYPLDLVDTEFAQFWNEWLFQYSTSVEIKFDFGAVIGRYNDGLKFTKQLRELIDFNNETVIRLGIDHEYLYPTLPQQAPMAELIAIHEKWAGFTKRSSRIHEFEQEVFDIVDALEKEFSTIGRRYNDLNNFVHFVEFNYKFFFLPNAVIERLPIHRGYQIKPSDTSFTRELICLPYYDIGRPQFEKYQVSRVAKHTEINDYSTITNHIHLTGNVMSERVPQEFYDLAQKESVPVFGNHLPVCKGTEIETYKFGEFFIRNFDPDVNSFWINA